MTLNESIDYRKFHIDSIACNWKQFVIRSWFLSPIAFAILLFRREHINWHSTKWLEKISWTPCAQCTFYYYAHKYVWQICNSMGSRNCLLIISWIYRVVKINKQKLLLCLSIFTSYQNKWKSKKKKQIIYSSHIRIDFIDAYKNDRIQWALLACDSCLFYSCE